MNNPISQQTLVEQSDERTAAANGRKMSGLAGVVVGIGLIISAILTVIYLMILVESALGLPSPYGYLFGLLVGVVAVIPAEIALFVWMARLNSESEITTAQRNIAVAAMVFAGIFSALTTSSFFSYFLPGLFPSSYMAIAPTLNVAAIVGSWIVFIMSIVGYGINSRSTRQNLAFAKEMQNIFNAKMDVVKAAGEAIRGESDKIIAQMNDEGLFEDDARMMIMGMLGMSSERMDLISSRDNAALPPPETSDPETVFFPAETSSAPATLEDEEKPPERRKPSEILAAHGAMTRVKEWEPNEQNSRSNGSDFPLK